MTTGPGEAGSTTSAPPPPPEEITVLGNKASQATGSAHVIRREQLDRFRYDDAHQILAGVPGVYVRGEDGFGLRPNIGIRGATSDRSKKLALMEDGVLFAPAPYSAPAAYYFPIMARARAIRVVKGSSAVAYGPQTVGGAIDLLTRDIPSSVSGMVDVAIGQFGYRKAHLVFGASDEHAGFLIEGVRISSTGFKTIDGDPGADTGYVRNEWMAKGRYEFDLGGPGHHELLLKVGYSDERSNETYMGVTDADFHASPYARYGITRGDQFNWHRTQIEASHRATYGRGLEFITTVYQHDLDRVWNRVKGLNNSTVTLTDVLLQPGTPRNSRFHDVISGRANSSGTDDQVTYGPNDRAFVARGIQTVIRAQGKTGPVEHKLEYGIRFHHDQLRRKQGEDAQSVVNGALVPSGLAYKTIDDNFAETDALAMHVFDQASYGRFLIAPGARVEFIQPRYHDYRTGTDARRSYQVLAPGVGAYAALTRELGLLGGVYRGFSPAPPEANRDTKPEFSVNCEFGARYASKQLRAELIGFFNNYSNLTDICTDSNGCSNANLDKQFDAGKVHIYGLEAYVESRPRVAPDWFIPLRGAFTYTRTRFLSSFTASDTFFGNVTEGDELPYIPHVQASGSVGVERARWGVNVSGTYVGAMREQAGGSDLRPFPEGTPKTDDYFVLDASASVRVVKNVTVYANGRNLLNNTYIIARRPFGARPGAPRMLQAGLQVSFNLGFSWAAALARCAGSLRGLFAARLVRCAACSLRGGWFFSRHSL